MTTIRLLDARRGLNIKCRELFRDEKIAEEIYRFLCDGIEECEDAESERKKGRWLRYGEDGYPNEKDTVAWQCDQCLTTYYGRTERIANYCPNCGARMEGAEDAGRNE